MADSFSGDLVLVVGSAHLPPTPSWLTLEPLSVAAARDRLTGAPLTAALVTEELPTGSGTAFITERVAAGCSTPLILLASNPDDELLTRALAAGAAACLDPTRLQARDLFWAVKFVGANRRAAEQRSAELLAGLATYLSHEGRNALAGVRGGVQVVFDHLPSSSPDRALCEEIGRRAATFSAALDVLTDALRSSDPSDSSALRRRINQVADRRSEDDVTLETAGELSGRHEMGLRHLRALPNGSNGSNGSSKSSKSS